MANAVTMPLKKSTNVRPLNNEWWLKRGLSALGRLAPDLAAGWAERMFLTSRRHARPEWENKWADSAERGEIRYQRALLPTYSWGRGPAVLLVHGWEGRATQLGSFVPALVAAGYRVVAVDMPGHGAAEPALSSMADFAFALTTIIQRLGPFHAVIAHSMGAAATALSCARAPFDARLVLIGAPRGPKRFFDGFTRYLGLDAKLIDRTARRIERRYGLPFSALDVDDFGARVAPPTLVVHDKGDKEVPFEHARAITDALPDATLVATDGLGHRRILRDEFVINVAVRFVDSELPRSLSSSPAA